LPLVAGLQRSFQRTLAQIVSVSRVPCKRPREPAQPRKQGQQFTLESLQQATPLLSLEETDAPNRFIHEQSKLCKGRPDVAE
jgi:hypothetical protein